MQNIIESAGSLIYPAIRKALLSPKETAQELDWSVSKLYNLWRDDPDNAPPSFRSGGNRYVSAPDLIEWIATRPRIGRRKPN